MSARAGAFTLSLIVLAFSSWFLNGRAIQGAWDCIGGHSNGKIKSSTTGVL